MKSAFWRRNKICLAEVERAPLRPGFVRIRVEACGICGTDLHLGGGDGPVTGHEVAGTVVELSPTAAGVSVGDKVAVDSASPCGRCASCHNGRQEFCTDIQSFWGSFGFCPEMSVPAISLLPSASLDPVIACLQEPLGVAIDMVRLAAIEPGHNVLLMGTGPIGLMTLPLVRRSGARRVFATGFRRRTARMNAALSLGADVFIDPSETPLASYKFGCEIDRILVTTPPATLTEAMAVAGKGGIIVYIGIKTGAGAFCTFDANAFHFKKLQLRASYNSPALCGPLALELLREKVVNGQNLVSHTFPLDDIAHAFQIAAHDPLAVKVVVRPGG